MNNVFTCGSNCCAANSSRNTFATSTTTPGPSYELLLGDRFWLKISTHQLAGLDQMWTEAACTVLFQSEHGLWDWGQREEEEENHHWSRSKLNFDHLTSLQLLNVSKKKLVSAAVGSQDRQSTDEPLKQGVTDMLVKHSLFSWDL